MELFRVVTDGCGRIFTVHPDEPDQEIASVEAPAEDAPAPVRRKAYARLMELTLMVIDDEGY